LKSSGATSPFHIGKTEKNHHNKNQLETILSGDSTVALLHIILNYLITENLLSLIKNTDEQSFF